MKSPRAKIYAGALGFTIIIWVGAILLARRTQTETGSDQTIKDEPARISISSLVFEVRLTCVLKQGAEIPPGEAHFVTATHAYLQGPAGRQPLSFASPVRFRHLSDSRVTIINRYNIDKDSDLFGQSVETLHNFDKVSLPITTVVWGKDLETITLLEVSVLLNGVISAYQSWPYNQPFNQGLVFTIDFAPLGKQLLIQ